jgi:hypothetical protein
MKRVLVEMIVPADFSTAAVFDNAMQRLHGLVVDKTYEPVPMSVPSQPGLEIAPSQQAVVIRGEIEDSLEEQLKAAPGVIGVWGDAPVEPFEASTSRD